MAETLIGLIENKRTPAVILETFRDYAESDAAISLESIMEIVDKSKLTLQELDTAYQHMQTGMTRQIASGQGVAGLEYFQAMNYFAKMIVGNLTKEDAITKPTDNSLAAIKYNLIMAHKDESNACLEKAINFFKKYVFLTNPDKFKSKRVFTSFISVKTRKRTADIYNPAFFLPQCGGYISPERCIMGIHATADLQIAGVRADYVESINACEQK